MMAHISEIAQLGAKVLRLQAQAVTDLQSAELQQIIDSMQNTLATTQGVGIAAPQISVSKRIIIIASRPTPALSLCSTDGTDSDD
jgi:peptide deformylase